MTEREFIEAWQDAFPGQDIPMRRNTKIVGVSVHEHDWLRFKVRAYQNKTTPSKLVRQFAMDYLIDNKTTAAHKQSPINVNERKTDMSARQTTQTPRCNLTESLDIQHEADTLLAILTEHADAGAIPPESIGIAFLSHRRLVSLANRIAHPVAEPTEPAPPPPPAANGEQETEDERRANDAIEIGQ